MSKSILSTLLYHSVFDYPLTVNEIHRYLISHRAVSLTTLKEEINSLLKTGKIISIDNFIFPSSLFLIPSSFVKLRLRRQKISAEKMTIAKRASKVISAIPWVKMIAVTGALAMENADKNDDIDLMIVTSGNCLWIVRPLAMILTSVFFKRRKPVIKGPALGTQGRALSKSIVDVSNAICLNLWLDESALEIPVGQRNLYTAHELAQMKPIVNKDGTYEKMMWENRWGRKYLANAWEDFNRQIDKWNPISLFNRIAFYLQLRYMRSKMTNERVSLYSAFFHPGNRADTILEKYDSLCHRHF